MFKKILVPLDGSIFAESALPFAEHLAKLFGAEVHLLRVRESITFQDRSLAVASEEDLAADLERLRKLLAGRGVNVRWDMATGAPHEAIDTYVRGFAVDLVAMATHGAGASVTHGLGSVAIKCMRMLNIPLYMIRPEGSRIPDLQQEPAPLRRVLIPLDGSMVAQGMLADIDPFLRRVDAEVRLIRVVPLNTLMQTRYRAESGRMVEEARRYLDDISAVYRNQGVRMGEPLVPRGEAATEILRAAREWDAELIAMTTHGRGGVSRLFFGSVAEKVLSTARAPVLLVRAR